MFLLALLLPWIALSQSIYVFFGGLVLNFLLAFGLGYAISRFRGGG